MNEPLNDLPQSDHVDVDPQLYRDLIRVLKSYGLGETLRSTEGTALLVDFVDHVANPPSITESSPHPDVTRFEHLIEQVNTGRALVSALVEVQRQHESVGLPPIEVGQLHGGQTRTLPPWSTVVEAGIAAEFLGYRSEEAMSAAHPVATPFEYPENSGCRWVLLSAVDRVQRQCTSDGQGA